MASRISDIIFSATVVGCAVGLTGSAPLNLGFRLNAIEATCLGPRLLEGTILTFPKSDEYPPFEITYVFGHRPEIAFSREGQKYLKSLPPDDQAQINDMSNEIALLIIDRMNKACAAIMPNSPARPTIQFKPPTTEL